MPEFVIECLGAQGDGVTGDLFARFALPGERIEGTVNGDRIENIRVLEPVSDRVKAPCRHFRSCGGCAVQHLADDGVARWKEDIVRQALARFDLTPRFRAIHTSPPRSRRRATFAARRTKKGMQIGFHRHGSDQIVDLSECHVLDPAITAALRDLAPLARLLSTRTQGARISVTATVTGLDVDIDTTVAPSEADLMAQASGISALARLSLNGSLALQNTAPLVDLGPARIELPPGAFLQATAAGQDALIAAVTDAVGASRQVADLFAGCGTFTLPLAQQAAVAAYEADRAMLAALDIGWRGTPGLRPVSTHARNLFSDPLQPADLSRFDAVVIDPPRAGARDQCRMLAQSSVPKIAFVSCNPATFARDARILHDGGYRLDWVQTIDQFRWSHHVELAALFLRD